MDLKTSGRYRVLGRPRDPDELLLVEVDDFDDADAVAADSDDADAATVDSEEEAARADSDPDEAFAPTYVDTTGYDGALADAVASLRAGTLVDATLAWSDGDPRFESIDLLADSVFEFYDGVTGIFEAAKQTWMVAEADNAAMNGRVTKNTDGEPNGALYVFAKQAGARDLFEEFRTGVTPLDPLVRRADRGESTPPETEQPRAVFVLRPADEPFLVVYVVFRRDGVLAETLRSTYGDPDS
ncbi:hypothetical protein D3D02_05705 [Halobellus sp. Atlit-38R]|uniref:DUF6663 family protein n=1 Tax=Halobellus sp. Atlit-38R TaxID=2282131 RepID=UPI000EF28FBC|nr:DUF6663 family protein [Halobellus sp. Atlit-38R]RLM90259.1 hypothetical protein D3D02_05705 [Halobellus sp. Atlit-38R]